MSSGLLPKTLPPAPATAPFSVPQWLRMPPPVTSAVLPVMMALPVIVTVPPWLQMPPPSWAVLPVMMALSCVVSGVAGDGGVIQCQRAVIVDAAAAAEEADGLCFAAGDGERVDGHRGSGVDGQHAALAAAAERGGGEDLGVLAGDGQVLADLGGASAGAAYPQGGPGGGGVLSRLQVDVAGVGCLVDDQAVAGGACLGGRCRQRCPQPPAEPRQAERRGNPGGPEDSPMPHLLS